MLSTPTRHTFTESPLWRTLAAIPFLLGLVVGIFGLALSRIFPVVLWGFVVLLVAPFPYACLWAAKRRVTINAEGIFYRSLLSEADLRWEEVTETRYSQLSDAEAYYRRTPILSALLAQDSRERTLLIVGPRTIKLTSNLQDIELAIRMVLASVNPRLQQKAEQTLASTGAVSFGGITLTRTGIIWCDQGPIPYDSLSKCRVDGKYLRVKAEGKWFDNIKADTKNVPNVFVLLDLVDAKRVAAGLTALQ